MLKLAQDELAQPSLLSQNNMTPNLSWTIQNKTYNAGDIVIAKFKVSNFTNITGYQFAMKFNPTNLEFVGVDIPADNPLQVSTNFFSWPNKPGYRVGPGEIRHLFSIPKGKTLPANTTAFSYVFKAKQAGELDDNLALATCCLSLPMKPLAYNYPLNLQTLSVSFVPSLISPIFDESGLAVL